MTSGMPESSRGEPRRQPARPAGWMVRMVHAELEALEAEAPGGLARSAALACAVPRWFNQELMVALMGGMLSAEAAQDILARMRAWEFVRSIGMGRFAYREEAREALLAGFESGPALRALHFRAHAFFDRQLGLPESELNETTWLRLRPEQFNALREKVYHLLRLDPARGFALFRALFRGAHSWYLPGEAEALLLTTRGMDLGSLPVAARDELIFFEAVQAGADYRYAEAEASLRALLERRLDPERERPLRARVMGELGKLYSLTGRLDAAASVFGLARVTWQQIGAEREGAAMANNLGSVYLGMRDYRRARQSFEQALAELRRSGSPAEVAQAYNNLGSAYEREEEWGRALDHYQRSLAMKEQIGDRFGAARTQANIGSVYHAQIRDVDNPRRAAQLRETAHDLYARSLATLRQYGARSEAARVQFKQALLYYQSGELEQARAALPEALEEYRALNIPGVENVENLAERLNASPA